MCHSSWCWWLTSWASCPSPLQERMQVVWRFEGRTFGAQLKEVVQGTTERSGPTGIACSITSRQHPYVKYFPRCVLQELDARGPPNPSLTGGMHSCLVVSVRSQGLTCAPQEITRRSNERGSLFPAVALQGLRLGNDKPSMLALDCERQICPTSRTPPPRICAGVHAHIPDCAATCHKPGD